MGIFDKMKDKFIQIADEAEAKRARDEAERIEREKWEKRKPTFERVAFDAGFDVPTFDLSSIPKASNDSKSARIGVTFADGSNYRAAMDALRAVSWKVGSAKSHAVERRTFAWLLMMFEPLDVKKPNTSRALKMDVELEEWCDDDGDDCRPSIDDLDRYDRAVSFSGTIELSGGIELDVTDLALSVDGEIVEMDANAFFPGKDDSVQVNLYVSRGDTGKLSYEIDFN